MHGGEHQFGLRIAGIGGRAGQQILHRLVHLAGLHIVAATDDAGDLEIRIGGQRDIDLAFGFLHAALVEIEDRQIDMRQRILRIEVDGLLQGLFGAARIADLNQCEAEIVERGGRARRDCKGTA